MENTLTPEQVVEKISEKFNETLAGMPTKSDVDSLKTEVESLKGLNEKSAEIEKAIAKFEGKLEAMAEKASHETRKPMTMAEAIAKAYVENHGKIKEMAEKGGMITLDTKADTTITGSYTGNIALSQLEPGVNNIARPMIKVRDIVNLGATSSKFVTYIAQTTQTSADWTDEAGVKVSGAPTWIEVSEEVKKIAGTVKVSKEMLDDLSFIRSEINRDLMASVESGMENALLNGAGGSEINGIVAAAQPFVPGANFVANVPFANLSDVLLVASAQIKSANFNPTHAVLHPNDAASLKLTKDADGGYTYPMFLMQNGELVVANLTIVESNYQTEGEFLVGDFSKSNVRIREAMNVQVGYVNDDFQRNMVTILAEMRLVQYIKQNDVNAFVKGNIAASITAILKP